MDFLTNNILRNPPILLAIIAIIGLVLQKKSLSDIIKGALLTAFGMVILDAGVGMLVGSILPINSAFQSLVASENVVMEGLDAGTFTSMYGGEVGLAMFIGLVLHLLIARFTPIKTIFLTGHMIWWFPFIFVASGVEAGLTGMSLIIFSALISAIYWSFMPWILRKYVWDVTGDKTFTLGHPTGMLSLISGFVASKVGNKDNSTEDLKLPKSLSFFREISIAGAITIFIMFVITGFMIKSTVPEGKSLIMFAIENGLKFGSGLIIMLHGVRMLISQIVPAFQGISEKLVPNALPAFDCPILFNYKPNAVLIGFIVAMISSTLLIIISNSMNAFGVILIPLVITSFFECGTAAVIADGQGGLKGAIIGTAVASAIMVLFMGISVIIYSSTIQNWMLIFGGNDFSLFGAIAKFIASIFSNI